MFMIMFRIFKYLTILKKLCVLIILIMWWYHSLLIYWTFYWHWIWMKIWKSYCIEKIVFTFQFILILLFLQLKLLAINIEWLKLVEIIKAIGQSCYWGMFLIDRIFVFKSSTISDQAIFGSITFRCLSVIQFPTILCGSTSTIDHSRIPGSLIESSFRMALWYLESAAFMAIGMFENNFGTFESTFITVLIVSWKSTIFKFPAYTAL